ncbi:MAG: hypothetical protein P9X24_15310 [Candidatus Hatepunaea meridiana]|nr:hypothetical protein [Candidatus Hatepunaea meridiana]
MSTQAFIEAIKNPLISALIAVVLSGAISYFVSNYVAKNQIKYSNVKSKTNEMNSAIRSFANNLHEMNSIIFSVMTVKYGIPFDSSKTGKFFDSSQTDKFNSLKQEIYETVKQTNILTRIRGEIGELEKTDFIDFLKHYNENAYQIYFEFKSILLGDIQNEIEKIEFAHRILLFHNENLSGKSFHVVLMEIDKMSIQRYFEEQW